MQKTLQSISLEDLKEYARIDDNDSDKILLNFALSAEDAVEQVLGYPLSDFEEIPEMIKQAVFIIATRRYEDRLGELLVSDAILARSLLVNYRDKRW